MTNPKLPPDIEGIREVVAEYLFTVCRAGSEAERGEKWEKGWAEQTEDIKKRWHNEATLFLAHFSKNHGVVVLDKDQTPPRRPLPKEEFHNVSPVFEEAALERMKSGGWRKVINLDGTPVKEG